MSVTDIRKYITILESRKADPNITYELKAKTKKAAAAGDFDSIVAKLKGPASGVLTKLAKEYKEADNELKAIQEKRDALNEKIREKAEDLFDVEDALKTRIIESIQLTITLSKYTPASSEEITNLDVDGLLTELSEKFPIILEALAELKQKYTTIETKTKKEVRSRVTTTYNESAETEEISKQVLQISKNTKSKIMNKILDFDNTLKKIKSVL